MHRGKRFTGHTVPSKKLRKDDIYDRTRAAAALVLFSCLILLFSHLSIRPLHRICAVFAVAFDRVDLVFLCRPVFEELQGHLREEGVA